MSDSVYGGLAQRRAAPSSQSNMRAVVLSDGEDEFLPQTNASDFSSEMSESTGMLGADQSFFGGDESDSEDSDDQNGEYWSSSAADLEAGGQRKDDVGDDDDDDEYEDFVTTNSRKEPVKNFGGASDGEDADSDDEAPSSEEIAQPIIGSGEFFGSYDGGGESDDDSESLDEQAYQFTLLGDGLYFTWNIDTGQTFLLAHETRPEVAFCQALNAEEVAVRSEMAAQEHLQGDQVRALLGTASHDKAVVPGILGFFVERVLRRGARSEKRATFKLGNGETAVSTVYETPQRADEESIGGDPSSTNYQLVQRFLRANEDEAMSLFSSRTPSVRDAIVGLRNNGGRDTWENERRHGALLDALCGEGSLRKYYGADDAHRLGHLRRFEVRGDTCYAREDAPENAATTTSVSPATATDSAWFIIAPTYYSLYQAHCRVRDASQTLLVRMRSNPAEVAHSAVPRQNGVAVEPVVIQIAKQASERELRLAQKRQLANAHTERVLDRLCASKPRIERLAANIGALGQHSATAAGSSTFIDALTALVGIAGAKALVGAERVDPENELARNLRDVIDLLGECESLKHNLRQCREEEAAEWVDEYADKDSST